MPAIGWKPNQTTPDGKMLVKVLIWGKPHLSTINGAREFKNLQEARELAKRDGFTGIKLRG